MYARTGSSKLTIEGDGPTIHNLTVKVDGQKIAGLRSLTLYIGNDSFTEADLTISVDDIDVSAEALAALEAYIGRGGEAAGRGQLT
jgi:hypothetical protein